MNANAALAAVLWIAAIIVLGAYLVRRRRRASIREKMMENLRK